jgi:transcriptional regulator with XRE-family HTH domain
MATTKKISEKSKPTHPVVRRIRQLLAEHGMGVRELGRRIGVSPQGMQRWWRGEALPSLENRLGIAEVFGVPFLSLRIAGEDNVDSTGETEEAVESYIASEAGSDLTDEESRQLRLSSAWVPGPQALSAREVHQIAELVRMRLRHPEQLVVLNPAPNNGSRPKKRK